MLNFKKRSIVEFLQQSSVNLMIHVRMEPLALMVWSPILASVFLTTLESTVKPTQANVHQVHARTVEPAVMELIPTLVHAILGTQETTVKLMSMNVHQAPVRMVDAVRISFTLTSASVSQATQGWSARMNAILGTLESTVKLMSVNVHQALVRILDAVRISLTLTSASVSQATQGRSARKT